MDAFFSKLPEFQKPPRHPKWMEVNLVTSVPGRRRFKAAQDWLDRAGGPQGGDRAPFDRFLTARGQGNASAGERERLYQDFVDSQRRQER